MFIVAQRRYKICEDVTLGLRVVETNLLGLTLVLKVLKLTSLHQI